VALDLGDPSSVDAAAAAVAELTAGVDLVINCAGVDSRAFGVDPNARGPFDVDAEEFTEVLRINVTGPMLVTRAFLPLLRSGTGAVLANISSQLGSMEVAAKMGRDTPYCVSKAALNNYTVKCAAALRPENIAVVAIHPGWVRTDMGGDEAPMSVEESAGAVGETLLGITAADTGRFLRWDGSDHPW
jgi:NAD(P)-dependent dehydrogenase (short-subunit alcohol dehydrogenase family)